MVPKKKVSSKKFSNNKNGFSQNHNSSSISKLVAWVKRRKMRRPHKKS